MTLSTKRFDYTLRSSSSGVEHGLLIDWTSEQEAPFQLVIKEQEPPENMLGPDNDELYTGRDLTDAWRIFFTNFVGGSGQYNRDSPHAVDSKFYTSEFVDISRPGDLKLQHAVSFVEIGQSVLNGLVIEAESRVVFGCIDGATSRVGWIKDDGTIGYAVAPDGGWPTDSLTALSTDGQYIYAAFSGSDWGIYRGNTDTDQWELWADLPGISALVHCGGLMYAVQGSDPGYIGDGNSATRQFVQLEVERIHKPSLTTFGFTSIGNWIYWGTTAGAKTYVYALQHDAAGGKDRFELYVELPSGFVGTTMHGYLGNLYIAGYYTSDRVTTVGTLGEPVGQGVVYMATENGIARLCNIGDDPNELPLDSSKLDSTMNNRVRVMYGYGAWLYAVTDRSLYRWDIDEGGLSHVMDVSNFYISAGEIVINPPPAPTPVPEFNITSFADDWDYEWGDEPTSVVYERNAGDVNKVIADGVAYWHSDTEDRAGHARSFICYQYSATFTGTACMQFVTTTLRQQALEFGCSYGGRTIYCQVRARESDDKFNVRLIGDAGEVQSDYFPERNNDHTFYLTFDGFYANLWLDGTQVFTNVFGINQPYSANYLYFGAGWGVWPGTIDLDWYLGLKSVNCWFDAVAPPGYVPGASMIPNMTVVNGVPFAPVIPQDPSTEPDGFLTIDVSQWYGGHTLNPNTGLSQEQEGKLVTSWRSAKMPTVRKHFTAIELFHDAVGENETISVDYETDDHRVGSFSVSGPSNSYVTIEPIDLYARAIQLTFRLHGHTTSTPVVHGACVRFNPLPTKIFQMLTQFKDNLRDYDGIDYNYLDAYEFVMAAADSGEVLELKASGVDVRAKVTGIRFLKAKHSRQHSYEPQGTALVQFQRVE